MYSSFPDAAFSTKPNKSVRPSVRPSGCLSVCLLSVCLSVFMSVCLSVRPAVCLSVCLSFFCLCVCRPCLSVCPPLAAFVYLTLYNTNMYCLILFSIHLGKNGQRILKVNNAGGNFGLNLKLNIQQYDYFGSTTSLEGLKVLIHHQDTPPMVDQLGFSLAPGTSTLAAIRKEKV